MGSKKEFDFIELISFILILLWCFNPVVSCFMYHINFNYSIYLKLLLFIIGICGYVYYVIYKVKLRYEKKYNFKEKLKENIPVILIFLLMVWAIVSTIFAENKQIAIFGETYRNEGLIVYFLYAGFILLASTIKNKKYISWIFKSIIISATVIVTVPLLAEGNISDIFTWGYKNIFYNSNHYGYFLLIATMLSLFNFLKENNKFKQIIYLILFSYLNYFFVVNDTFGSYLAFIVSIFSLLVYSIITKWKIKKNLVTIIAIVFVSVFARDVNGVNIAKNNFTIFYNDIKTIFQFEIKKQEIKKQKNKNNKLKIKMDEADIIRMNNVGTQRMLLWKEAGLLIKEHPIVGGGIESLKWYYFLRDVPQDRPHNIIVQIAAFIGIPGAIFYVLLILYVALLNLVNIFRNKNILRIIVFFTAMSYFISSLFGNTMYYTSPYFMILIGMLINFVNIKPEVEDNNKKLIK